MEKFVLGVIPARLNSSRLPNKALALINGKPMVQHTYEAVCKAQSLSKVIVATDSEDIARVIRAVGGEEAVVMTRADHKNGTERALEVCSTLAKKPYLLVNVQADQPFIEAEMINALVQPYLDEKESALVSTLACDLNGTSDYNNPHVVKVLCSRENYALYFSRAPIPYRRENVDLAQLPVYHHIGVYAFFHTLLEEMPLLKPSPLELAESLEQLRFLEYDKKIAVRRISKRLFDINTIEDLHLAQKTNNN